MGNHAAEKITLVPLFRHTKVLFQDEQTERQNMKYIVWEFIGPLY